MIKRRGRNRGGYFESFITPGLPVSPKTTFTTGRLRQSREKKGERMKTGKIKWFDKKRGFGFITCDEGQDYFFHVSEFQGTLQPENKDKVSFEPEEAVKGIKAVNVRKIPEQEQQK